MDKQLSEEEVAKRMIEMHGPSKAALNATDHAFSYGRHDARRGYWLRIYKLIIKNEKIAVEGSK